MTIDKKIPEWVKDKLADVCDDLTNTVWELSEMGLDESKDPLLIQFYKEMEKANKAASCAWDLCEAAELKAEPKQEE